MAKGTIVKLRNVELVWPRLGTPQAYQNVGPRSWSGHIILNKEQFDECAKAFEKECKSNGFTLKDVVHKSLKGSGTSNGVEGKMCVKFKSNEFRKAKAGEQPERNRPPGVVDRANQPLDLEACDKLSSGTIAHVAVKFDGYRGAQGPYVACYPVQFQIQKAVEYENNHFEAEDIFDESVDQAVQSQADSARSAWGF
jgi:hypothetical protein